MGGHGALVSFLKNPGQYKSVSAFAPISNPCNCDWGKFAFNGYLGSEETLWKVGLTFLRFILFEYFNLTSKRSDLRCHTFGKKL